MNWQYGSATLCHRISRTGKKNAVQKLQYIMFTCFFLPSYQTSSIIPLPLLSHVLCSFLQCVNPAISYCIISYHIALSEMCKRPSPPPPPSLRRRDTCDGAVYACPASPVLRRGQRDAFSGPFAKRSSVDHPNQCGQQTWVRASSHRTRHARYGGVVAIFSVDHRPSLSLPLSIIY